MLTPSPVHSLTPISLTSSLIIGHPSAFVSHSESRGNQSLKQTSPSLPVCLATQKYDWDYSSIVGFSVDGGWYLQHKPAYRWMYIHQLISGDVDRLFTEFERRRRRVQSCQSPSHCLNDETISRGNGFILLLSSSKTMGTCALFPKLLSKSTIWRKRSVLLCSGVYCQQLIDHTPAPEPTHL